ncbi:MAG: hypothetical protein DBY41_04830 [Clostridium sp.]|nr:MAG: hypothetical protein DBY41_04830 [Clostridium sp.]
MDFSLKQIMKVIIVLVCAVAVIGISIFLTNRNNENTTANQDALINTSPYKSVLSNADTPTIEIVGFLCTKLSL